MNSKYEIVKNTLETNNFKVDFTYNIADVKYWDDIYVVLLTIPNEINETENIYGVNIDGEVIWRIENPINAFKVDKDEQGYNYLSSSVYTHMHLSSNGTFTATTFFAMKYVFDSRTGKLLKKEFGRW
jgi:hypothetical protein